METPTKHEQFRVIKCAFRKYTTLSAGTASVSGQQTVFDGASNHKRSSMGRVSAVPAPGCASTDVATSVFGGTSNRKRSSVGRVSAVPVPGRGVLSLWSFSAIPAGVSVYFLHFYNQYSSFVSLFLLCLSLFIHKSTKSVRRHSTETMLRCANYSFLSSFASTSNSSIICSLISSLNSSYMLSFISSYTFSLTSSYISVFISS